MRFCYKGMSKKLFRHMNFKNGLRFVKLHLGSIIVEKNLKYVGSKEKNDYVLLDP